MEPASADACARPAGPMADGAGRGPCTPLGACLNYLLLLLFCRRPIGGGLANTCSAVCTAPRRYWLGCLEGKENLIKQAWGHENMEAGAGGVTEILENSRALDFAKQSRSNDCPSVLCLLCTACARTHARNAAAPRRFADNELFVVCCELYLIINCRTSGASLEPNN